MPLEAGTPAKNRCGTCRECTDNAALYALRDSDFKSYPVGEEVFDVEKCASKPQEFAKDPDIGTMVWDMHKGLSHGGKKKNKTGEEDKRA